MHGAAAGTATLDFQGSFTSGVFRVTYQGYSDDGRTFLDGTEAFDNGSILSSGAYEVDLRSTGAHEGSMTGRIAIDGTAISGSITSVVDGNQLTWPPPACPPPTTESSEYKLFATEFSKRLANASMDLGGPGTQLRVNTEDAPMKGRAESTYRYTVIDTIGGGASEIQKNIIARRALGLPKNF